MNPLLSIVTGTRNRLTDLCRLLRSLQTCSASADWELIVSDASDVQLNADAVYILAAYGVRIIREQPRLGCTKGYNAAFKKATGKWVIWLNDDCEVLPGYDVNAIRFMESNPAIGLGALYYSEPGLPYHINQCCYGMDYANFGIILRSLGEQVGWFDEDIVMYGNDNSLAYRVMLAGAGIAGIPDARVFHHSTKDHHRLENNNQAFRVEQAELLKSKYGPRVAEMKAVYEKTRAKLVLV